MPNHITNKIEIINASVEQLQKIREYIKSEESPFDFNKIIPMPEELNIESGSNGKLGLFINHRISPHNLYKKSDYNEAKKDFDKYSDEQKKSILELGDKYYSNIINYGHPTWYDWRIEKWGTKWNAYSFDFFDNDKEDVIYFQTAWSAPLPVILELSNVFPDVSFSITYADEDAGANCGILVFKAGEVFEGYQPESYSEIGYEIYFQLNPNSRNKYVLREGKYYFNDY